ncbi:hypothetical protein TNCT_221051 [Trichonephila clavata]|uniref:RNase H type-1 domain-containing protein n=1 Tax=Trichonephila clavata TaxID=2740835 RepID=A0A8X6KZI3_TRICU|nr:hypothetical protein TNCT_221051 [Trichonephila clavata]
MSVASKAIHNPEEDPSRKPIRLQSSAKYFGSQKFPILDNSSLDFYELGELLNSFTRAVVFCDSKAAIFAENSSSTPASNILDSKKLLLSLSECSKRIALHWIPGDCGVTGNELADHLMKKELPFTRQQGKLSLLPVPIVLLREKK